MPLVPEEIDAMSRPDPLSDQSVERNDPFGLSKFSIRRYSVQHILLLFTVIGLMVATNILTALHGNAALMVLAGTMLGPTLAMTGLVLYVGIRTVRIEIWIRRLGMGDFEYRIEPKGNDEVFKPAWPWRRCGRVPFGPCNWT